MNKLKLVAAFFAVSAVCVNGFALASEIHDSHTHGTANLTLAIDSGAIEVQFESPAINLLGFEHTPKTETQMETVNKTKSFFAKPENVLSIQDVKCSSTSVDVDILGNAGEHLDEHKKREHEHHHKEHQAKAQSHSEVSATYRFDCTDDQTPESITILIFKHFPSLEKIKVNWVTQTQQGEGIASSQSPNIELR